MELKFDIGRDEKTGKRITQFHTFKGTKKEANGGPSVPATVREQLGKDERVLWSFPVGRFREMFERASPEERAAIPRWVSRQQSSAPDERRNEARPR